jgi:TetR/AcrR family transcriptional regulator, transcriptional repressor for nem operon
MPVDATEPQHESKRTLLEAAVYVIRAKGYTATRVEDICEAAGLTKGSFFHHFTSKEALALAAVEHWNAATGELFSTAAYQAIKDPVDRLVAYVDFRKSLLEGDLPEFTCLVGTMVQEIYETHPPLRAACDESIRRHAATLEPAIAEAMRLYGVTSDWTPRSLALYTQAVIQGSFILAKANGGPEVAAACIDHLRRYIEMLFGRTGSRTDAETKIQRRYYPRRRRHDSHSNTDRHDTAG